MKRRILKVLAIIIALTVVLAAPVSAAEDWSWGWDDNGLPHGTADRLISEAEINNTPPANYIVNSDTQGEAKDSEYCEYFLEDALQIVDINIDENNLNYLLQNAKDEPYVMTQSVTIGGKTLSYCGLRTKGSYTLEHSYADNPGSDRFSFTVNFGKYIKKKDYGEKQNFYGCDKISFNNFFFDKSMMKEFFALKLMDEMGLPTPQYGLAKLYINGNYYGVYAMVEAMDNTILQRYFNVDSDELSSYLCKPEWITFIRSDIRVEKEAFWEYDEDTYADVEDMLPTVFDWVDRLNCLSEGTDFEGNEIDINSDEYLELLGTVLNTDEVVKYFAAHSWLCQMDNMFVNMKNFGIYIDQNGVCTMVPWDYDLSFGCFFPSTAEDTANYPLDVMYRLGRNEWDDEAEFSSEKYAEFPLFNVIYQNDKLMEQYHGYMLECSKIAALGGTVESTGKSYPPAYFNSYIEKMKEEVIDAASEKLADNVYYMNWIRQPSDVKKALPNLSRIITQRAVGVALQVQGIDSIVCSEDCDLETLGNGMRGESSRWGKLTVADEATGIYVSAEYENDMFNSAPTLSVYKLTEDDSTYKEIENKVVINDESTLLVYSMRNKGDAMDGYTVNIPLAQEYLEEGFERVVYSYSDGKLAKLKVSENDNICTVRTDSIDYIAVLVRPEMPVWLYASVGAGGIAIIAVLLTVIIKKSRKKKTVDSE